MHWLEAGELDATFLGRAATLGANAALAIGRFSRRSCSPLSEAPPMSTPRYDHQLLSIAGGRVLAVGGTERQAAQPTQLFVS